MENKFLQPLHSGRVLLMDGAMGTELQRAGIHEGECHEQWNLTHPERVLAIHRAYVAAGAEVLLTNTFQANPNALKKHQLQEQLVPLSQSGVRLARQGSGSQNHVLADIGPLDDPANVLAPVILALAETDGLLLETLSDLEAVEQMATMGRDERHPVLASFAYCRDAAGELRTFTGLAPEAVARGATKHGVHGLGVNCGKDISMDDIIEIVRRYRAVTDLPLFARPNAGTPTKVDGQWVYPHTPEQMAAKLPALLDAGVAMVGGCCGTSPAHIAAFRQVIDAWNARKTSRGA